jgi:2-C-methyl-D-erythritol 2,4-cyclodiphosphate synthase
MSEPNVVGSWRVGTGFDSHAFAPGIALRLGGVTLESPRGLQGHSDGDVLLHAVCDALLGAAALGDIGARFPPGAAEWKNADSRIFVRHAVEAVHQAGWRVANLDATLILESPKLGPHRDRLRASVAELLQCGMDQVSIKAKTPEGLSWADTAVAQVMVLIYKR